MFDGVPCDTRLVVISVENSLGVIPGPCRIGISQGVANDGYMKKTVASTFVLVVATRVRLSLRRKGIRAWNASILQDNRGRRPIGPHHRPLFCRRTITDTADDGGTWIVDGEVRDVDGKFIASLAQIHDDDVWHMFDPDTGEVYRRAG